MASPRTKLFLLALIPVALLALLWLVAATRPTDDPGAAIEISGPMPEVRGPALVEGAVSPGLYRGKVVVVNFWATWCGPCRREQPALESLWREFQAQGVQFIGVDFRDDTAAAREYVREFDVTYPSVVDDGRLAYDFGVPYLPATILVGADGEMRYRLLGAQTESELRGFLQELLAERG